MLLDRIQGMYPGNFHPRSFLAISGNDEESVLKTLDDLHKDGLVERTRAEPLPDELLVRLTEKGRPFTPTPRHWPAGAMPAPSPATPPGACWASIRFPGRLGPHGFYGS